MDLAKALPRTNARVAVALAVLHLLAPPALAQASLADTGTAVRPVELSDTERHVVHSIHVEDAFVVDVALPPGYEPEGSYPLVVATDGGFTFSTIASSARVMTAVGELPPFVLVAIGYNTSAEAWTKRYRDLSPTHDPQVRECRSAQFVCGGASAFLSFVTDELYPFLEERYAVDLGNVTYVGHSMGGLFGGWVLFTAPTTFQNYILGSPYFKWDNRVILTVEAAYSQATTVLPARLYMAVGSMEEDAGVPFSNDEAIASFTQMRSLLEDRQYEGLRYVAEVMPGELHVSVFPALVFRGLRAVLNPSMFQALGSAAGASSL